MGGDRIPGPVNDAVDLNVRQREEFAKRHPIGEKEMKRIQAALDQAKTAWIAEFARLDKIAKRVYYDDHSAFVTALADTWLKADQPDKRILQSAWASIITKYALEVEAEG